MIAEAQLTVRRLRESDAEAYDRFLLDGPASMFYHSRRFANLLSDLLGCTNETLLAMEGDSIVGVFPLMRLSSPLGDVYNSMPYYGSNGGIIATTLEARTLLVAEYNRIATDPGTLAATTISDPLAGGEIAGLVHNYGDYRIGMLTSIEGEDVLTKIDSTARRNVQKAERSDLEVFHDPAAMERLHELHVENMTAIRGPAKSRRFFDLIPLHFDYGRDYAVYAARKDGHIVATLLVFFFNRTVEYYTPAIEEAYRSDQPLSLLCVRAMRDAAARGFHWWNWGGTHPDQTGVYRFKRKWASTEQRYNYYTHVNRDEILDWPAERFGKEFPNFFVVPFAALRSRSTP